MNKSIYSRIWGESEANNKLLCDQANIQINDNSFLNVKQYSKSFEFSWNHL